MNALTTELHLVPRVSIFWGEGEFGGLVVFVGVFFFGGGWGFCVLVFFYWCVCVGGGGGEGLI